jgi:hypothetical protein
VTNHSIGADNQTPRSRWQAKLLASKDEADLADIIYLALGATMAKMLGH